MKRLTHAVLVVAMGLGGVAYAKLPTVAPTPEQQAKAAEAKAKADEAAKKDAEQLGKAQDRAADNYKRGKGRVVASAKK